MTGSEARVIAKKALDSLDNSWNKVNTRDDAFGRANYELVKGAMDELRAVMNRIPDGNLPAKAPGNITWDLHNALARIDGANKTLVNYGVESQPSFVKELAEQTGLLITNPKEALSRAGDALSDLAHGKGAFDWLPDFSKWVPIIIGLVVVVLVSLVILRFKK